MSKFLITLEVEARDLDVAVEEVRGALWRGDSEGITIVGTQRASTQY